MQILITVLEVISLLILVVTCFLLSLWAIGNFKSHVPFITASKHVLDDIARALKLDNNSVLYDLGSGDGRILFHLFKTNKEAKYVGIEHSLFPFIMAKGELLIRGNKAKKNIEIYRKDFFDQDVSSATHVFMYLYPDMMDELLPKLVEELKPGTRLVSLSFKFANKKPIEEIDLKRNKFSLGKKIYVYQF